MKTHPRHDPYLALRFPDFRLLLAGNLIAFLGSQMLTLAIGWELYERTRSALNLGFVGLVQVLPVLALVLVTGHVADRYDRKKIVMLSQLVIVAGSIGLTAIAFAHGSLFGIYACLLINGIGTAFNSPASRTLTPEVVPEWAFENAATWSSSSLQVASVVGPALGGVIIAVFGQTQLIYVLNAVAALTFAVLLIYVRGGPARDLSRAIRREPPTLRSLGEGIGFLRRTPIILAVITLDLFAVLFGGATTLLPIFARDILQVGPTGLGWLRAAPSIGALCVAFYLAHRPPMQRAGVSFLAAVAGFGVATIVFGLSRSFGMSLLMLFILGGLDNVSVVVRNTLSLLRTPNEMRGRVAAINGLFISASNQLGGFESGLTAQLFGPVFSVVAGGVGTIVVVALAALTWPALRSLRTLREPVADVEVSVPFTNG